MRVAGLLRGVQPQPIARGQREAVAVHLAGLQGDDGQLRRRSVVHPTGLFSRCAVSA